MYLYALEFNSPPKKTDGYIYIGDKKRMQMKKSTIYSETSHNCVKDKIG